MSIAAGEQNLPFVPSAHPFSDFLLVFGEKDGAQDIAPGMARLGLGQARSFPGLRCRLFASHDPGEGRSGLLLSGYGQSGGRFFLGADEARPFHEQGRFRPDLPSPSAMPMGNYSAVAWDAEGIELYCDPFGQSSLYVFDRGGPVVVANSYHLLLLAVRALGLPVAWNRAAVHATLYSESRFFHQHVMHDRQLAGARLLRVDRYVSVTRQGLRERDLEPLCEALRPLPMDRFDALIEQARDEVLENLRAVYDYPGFSLRLANLSGGKDSRAVFAGILANEGSIERTRFLVHESNTKGDPEVASGLLARFGGQHFDGGGLVYRRQTPGQATAFVRSYLMGTRFGQGAAVPSRGGMPVDGIRIAGGVCEVTRCYWLPAFERQLAKDRGTGGLLRWLRGRLSGKSRIERFAQELSEREFRRIGLPVADREDVAHALAATLSSLSDGGLEDSLDLHYLFFRNRSHFGHSRIEGYHRQPNWHPLMSLSMLRAARSLPLELRRTPLVVLRLTAALHPELPWYDYAEFSLASSDYLPLLPPAMQREARTIRLTEGLSDWQAPHESLKRSYRNMEGALDLPQATPAFASWPEQKRHDTLEALRALQEQGWVSAPLASRATERFEAKRAQEFGRLTTVHDQIALLGRGT